MRHQVPAAHVALLATGFLAGALVYFGAFGPYLVYDGEPPAGQFIKLFLLPVAATTIVLIVRNLRNLQASPAGLASADEAIDGIVFFVTIFLLGVQILLLAVLLQISWVQLMASRLIAVLLGVALVGVGNLLPRTRPNPALGIRTTYTLADRQFWMITHRITGYVSVAAGLAMIAGGFLSDAPKTIMVASGTIGAAITVASYLKTLVTRRKIGRI